MQRHAHLGAEVGYEQLVVMRVLPAARQLVFGALHVDCTAPYVVPPVSKELCGRGRAPKVLEMSGGG